MFITKLWNLLVAILAVLLLGSLLVATKPHEYFMRKSQESQLDMAQGFFEMVMARQNRNILDVMGKARLHSPLVKAVSGKGDDGRKLAGWLESIRKRLHLDAIFASDAKGKVVASAGDRNFSSIRGLPEFRLVLKGYHLDNTTILNTKKGERIHWIFAVPVLDSSRKKVIGALVGLRVFDEKYLKDLLELVGKKGIQLGAYRGNAIYAKTIESPVWEKSLMLYGRLRKELEKQGFTSPVKVTAGGRDYLVVLSSLRGSAVKLAAEEQEHKSSKKAKSRVPDNQLYWAITWQMPPVSGTWAFMDKVVPSDVLFEDFPWVLFILVALILVAGGVAVSWWEVDRQMNALIDRVGQLAQGTIKLINDQEFRGKFSSMARAINTAIEKAVENASPEMVMRAKSMDELLGEKDEGPRLPEGGVPAPPPGGKRIEYPEMKRVSLPGQQSGAPEGAAPPEKSGTVLVPPSPSEDPTPYFTKVTEDFKKLKHELGETLEGFDDKEFMDKLAKTTEELREKFGVERIRFTVYERDGKAALKAAPYRTSDK